MTGPFFPEASRSVRRSARVDVASSPDTEFPGLAASKGPESMVVGGRGLVPASAERRTSRVSSRQLASLVDQLSARDLAILTTVQRFHYLTSSQIQFLFFYDQASTPTAARLTRRLTHRLAEHRVLEPLERRIGGVRAGSSGYVWRVGPIGDRVLRQQATDAGRSRRKEPSQHHLSHTLAVADCYCRLVASSRGSDLQLLQCDPEPDSWRPYLGQGGSPEVVKPDLYAVTAGTEFEDHWFVEVDLATESLPVLLRKCDQYERYRRSGVEQRRSDVFPLVLWAVPDHHRAEQLTGVIARTRSPSMFRVALADNLAGAVSAGGAL